MSHSVRRVLIPLGATSSGQGRVAHVLADNTRPSNDAKLIPEIALLNDCKLYPAGTIALSALRQVSIRPSRLAITQWFIQTNPAYLSVSNAPELYGLTPENSLSAQLGLALASAMYQCQSKARLVIATGELLTKSNLADSKGSKAKDVAVGPVGLIDAKIKTVATLLDDYKGGAFSSVIPFFFPKYTSQGEETFRVHEEAFAQVVTAYKACGIALELHPVMSLREALGILGLSRLRPGLWDYAAVSGVAAMMLLGVGLSGYHALRDRPISLTFASAPEITGNDKLSPFPILRQQDGRWELASLNAATDGTPIYNGGSFIAIRVQIADTHPAWLEALGDYHFAAVTISEKSGVKVFPPETWRAKAGSKDVSFALPVTDAEEANKLIILARRFQAFDTEALHDEIAKAVASKPPGERINAAINALVKIAPGYIDYSFLSVKGKQ